MYGAEHQEAKKREEALQGRIAFLEKLSQRNDVSCNDHIPDQKATTGSKITRLANSETRLLKRLLCFPPPFFSMMAGGFFSSFFFFLLI